MSHRLSDREVLARLVSFPTVSGRPNAPLLDWAEGYLEGRGLRIVRQEGPDPGRGNLVAATPAAGGGGLTLAGHVDVVPAEEPGWESDPFELVEREGALVGRGAVDMKGFCALALNRLADAAANPPPRPLALLLTYDEEVGSLGARRFVEDGPREPHLPLDVVVGEPTSLRVARMHKGHLRIRVTLEGRPAHTGTPSLGLNAVEAAGPVLAALAALRREMEAEGSPHGPHFPDAPYAVLAVAGIRGGEAWNVVPARCEVDLGLRPMPGTETAAVIDRLRTALGVTRDGAALDVELVGENPPLLTAEDDPLHRALSAMMEQTESLGLPFASDGGWLARGGYRCVVFGPGTMDAAHRPNEALPLAEMEAAGRHLDELIERACRSPRGLR